ncbi:sugar MFS transporter [Sphingobium tyrosinilyticum]|uniref:Sugar MFS transporter n=1 Tax=Sphingobium tyrosinilyticum TaxID=2715436 RepID=A0ABV9EY81_9SPHN
MMATQAEAHRESDAERQGIKLALAFAISCFVIWGLAYGLLDVLNKHFQETLHVGKAESSLLQMAYFGAYLIMSVPAGMLMKRAGYKAGLVSGLVITALGAFLFIPSAGAESFPLFVGSMFVLATGIVVLETSADTYVNVLGDPAKASYRLNLAQSFNAVGVFIGPLIGGAFFFNPDVTARLGGELTSVQITYGIIGVLVLAYAFVLARVHLPEIRAAEDTLEQERGQPLPLSRHRHFVFGVATQALYIGAQVGVGAYFINLVTETWDGLSSQQGAYLLSIAMFGYLIGRFVSTALLVRIPPRALLTAYGVFNTMLTVVVAMGIQKVSAIALIGVFFFMSTMFATIFTLGVKDLGSHTKSAASIMVMSIGGGVLLPYPMGMIADHYGSPAAFWMPAVIFAIVALYGWKGAEQKLIAA